jgi:hypothetical protein
MKRLLAVLATAALLASCATTDLSRGQGDAAQLADLVNSGQAKQLAALSAVPFLLDGEILALKGDVASFWQGVVSSGYRIAGASVQRSVPPGPDGYRDFADTMDVKVFFKKYLGKDTRLVELATSDGKRVLLLMADGFASRAIYGFRGPF